MAHARSLIAGLTLAILTAAPALADGVQATEAWARARIPQARAGAAYLNLTNTGSAPDQLVSAASPVADVVEVHRHVHDNGVMRMEHLQTLALPAGETVTFEPGGLHLMLIGLQRHLKEGELFPLTLTFATAAPVTVSVNILGMAASGPNR
jgi:periplasmic copper chaperone A